MVGRLNRLSVERHFDAYADIDWDDPALALDPADPRFELPAIDPLRHTDWYAARTPAERAALGCYRWAACMKTGWHFENLLQRGLLRHAFELRNGAPEFRYLHHEIIEESQHTLMFQEFVNRSGLPVRGMPWVLRRLAETFVVPLARLFPTLFFLFVLGGEDPVDHLQRRVLSDADTRLHPLVERIMRIHTTEEARHLSFARHYLQRTVPDLGFFRRLCTVDVLVLDDLGAEKQTEWVLEQLYSIVNERWQNERAIVVTSNPGVDELREQIGQRTVSRLEEITGDPIPIMGRDLRIAASP